MNFYNWMKRREAGLPGLPGDDDFLKRRLYKNMDAYTNWNGDAAGAVFNFEFSPDGNVLVAACEKKTILLFDSITTKNTFKIPEAHADNVNCIKFLDDRIFASCSDDTTVALWDLRYLKMKLRSLHGHLSWVKNIEYSHKDHLLVTSGFDGSIFTWDINSHTEQGLIYQKVFHTSGLMRCRIAADSSKLVICTTGGYLMIIHNLDLTTLHKDLCGFRPGIYRLMQTGHQYIPLAAKFDHVFSKRQKKNRVELVTDFPDKNDAEVILALQIHPQGHSFLSRNISYDELTEWSCVHDFKEEPGDVTDQIRETSVKRKRKLLSDSDDDEQRQQAGSDPIDDMLFINRRHHQRNQRLRSTPAASARGAPIGGGSSASGAPTAGTARPAEPFVPDIWAAEVTVQERTIRQNRARNLNSVTGYSFVYAINSGVLPAAAHSVRSAQQQHNSSGAAAGGSIATIGGTLTAARGNSNNNNNNSNNIDGGTTSSSSSSSSSNSSSSNGDSPPSLTASWLQRPYERIRLRPLIAAPLHGNSINGGNRDRIFQNPKKLMYYIQEPNVGKGFIKEPCFSTDGRVICSPYDNGVRLLAFNADCSAYPHQRVQHDDDANGQGDVCKRNPRQLYVVKEIATHADIVLSTKFSPREPLLVTGCRAGKVVWHHPVL